MYRAEGLPKSFFGLEKPMLLLNAGDGHEGHSFGLHFGGDIMH